MQFVEVFLDVEDAFGIRIEDDAFLQGQSITVGMFEDYVWDRIAESRSKERPQTVSAFSRRGRVFADKDEVVTKVRKIISERSDEPHLTRDMRLIEDLDMG